MKLLLILILSAVLAANLSAQTTLIGWQVSGQTSFGTQGLPASSVAPRITNSTGLTRGAGVGTSGSATSNAWGGNTWNHPTADAAIAANAYVTYGLAVGLSYSSSMEQIALKYRRSSTGPPNAECDFQINGGAWTKIADISNLFSSNSSSGSSITPIDISTIQDLQDVPAGTIVNFRIVPYGATSSSGTWYVYGTGTALGVNGSTRFLGQSGSGIGTATVSPARLSSKQTSDFTIRIASDDSTTIAKIMVVIPPALTWSMNPSDVSMSGKSFSSADCRVFQDTISVIGAAVIGSDTGEIVVHSVTVPDSSMTALFIISTAVDTALPSPIMKQPRVAVIKLERIIDLHINDSQGVPAAPYKVGTAVTVCGIITANTSTSQTNLFLQNASGGINIFSYTYFDVFQVGDSAEFTGTIQQYRGTTEITPDSGNWIIYSHGNPLPDPLVVTCEDANQTFNDDYSEPNESRLVRINNVTFNASNGTVTDVTGTTGCYIPKTWTVPPGTFDVIGILKQYKGGNSDPGPPYLSDYEVNPRSTDDIAARLGPVYTISPTEESLKPNSVTIGFNTSTPSAAVVRYGTTSSYSDSIVTAALDTIHVVLLEHLSPATVYHYQVSTTDQSGANTTGDAVFSTASPDGTTGTMNVYFNKPVDVSVARGELAQTVDIASKFIARIDSAKYSIDIALYSLSGGVGSNIANHLLSAKARGVKIRMIAENGNSNTSPMSTMKNSVPFITDAFDPVDAGTGLMHNKFAVFDFRDTTSFTDDWVWTGSWNATDPGNNDDAQNVIEIQDKALANAYTIELQEMWGSATDSPDASHSRFGAHKLDITPHKFNIAVNGIYDDGIPVELYFSPSDQTTLHLYRTLAAAARSINICMLTFTRSDLSYGLLEKKTEGAKVRILLDNNIDTGSQFGFLQTAGIDIHLKGSDVSGFLHHKYAVIDGEDPLASQVVTTGSHNWSTSAETSNDENELIIHSNRIANLYLQEFKARYIGAGGTDNIVLGVRPIAGGSPKGFSLSQNYPNPFNPTTNIEFQIAKTCFVSLKVYDILGREVKTLVSKVERPGSYEIQYSAERRGRDSSSGCGSRGDAGNLPSGVYFYRLQAGEYSKTLKMLIMK